MKRVIFCCLFFVFLFGLQVYADDFNYDNELLFGFVGGFISSKLTDHSDDTFESFVNTLGTTLTHNASVSFSHISTARVFVVERSGTVRITFYHRDGQETFNLVDGENIFDFDLYDVNRIALFLGYQSNVKLASLEVWGDEILIEPPDSPVGLNAVSGDGNVYLSWNVVDGAEGYRVYRDGVMIADVTDTSYMDYDVINGAVYNYTVTAYNSAGESDHSQPVGAMPEASLLPPQVPTGFMVFAGDGEVSLVWNSVPGADGYRIYRDGIELTEVTGTSFKDTDVVNGVTYLYYIVAFNDAGVSEPTETLEATPERQIVEMSDLRVQVSDTRAGVSWRGGHAPFTVDWGISSDSVDTNYYIIEGLEPEIEYSVMVSDVEGQSLSTTFTTAALGQGGILRPYFPSAANLVQKMLDGFGTVGRYAVGIIGAAVVLGVLIILAYYTWRLSKKWLASSK